MVVVVRVVAIVVVVVCRRLGLLTKECFTDAVVSENPPARRYTNKIVRSNALSIFFPFHLLWGWNVCEILFCLRPSAVTFSTFTHTHTHVTPACDSHLLFIHVCVRVCVWLAVCARKSVGECVHVRVRVRMRARECVRVGVRSFVRARVPLRVRARAFARARTCAHACSCARVRACALAFVRA